MKKGAAHPALLEWLRYGPSPAAVGNQQAEVPVLHTWSLGDKGEEPEMWALLWGCDLVGVAGVPQLPLGRSGWEAEETSSCGTVIMSSVPQVCDPHSQSYSGVSSQGPPP